MVTGLASFQDRFKDYSDCYTVIGGAACDILMTDADIPFRATKDIDMILILEDRFQEFARVFWAYIEEGGYRCGWKSSQDIHFYRFTEPKPGYPIQIELFSRKPDYHLSAENAIVPIHIDDDISSLSAILLNDDFYHFMMEGRVIKSGICVLDAAHLIPFKMYAWLNLTEQKIRGEHVNERDLKKHKHDVFRLTEIMPSDTHIDVRGTVASSIDLFLQRVVDEPLSLSQLGLTISKEQALSLLHSTYAMH